MPIASSDIKYILSGGTANADPNASLGGARSTAGGAAVITSDGLNNVWDNVSGDDSAAGDTEYRCIYIDNQHGSLTLTGAVCWIESNTSNANTDITIGLDAAAVDGTAQGPLANENTAPGSVTFVAAVNKAGGLALGNLTTNTHRAIWIKRVVTAGATASNNDAYTLKTEGETAA